MSDSAFEKLSFNQVRQVHKRGQYDQKTVFEILDDHLIGNVAFATEATPFVIPMLYARCGNELLFHGSPKSRLMSMLCSGQTVCVSATTLDGLVLAKSLFHHSMNYRSVCVYGAGHEVTDETQRLEALKTITDKTMPGRWDDARQPSEKEMKATCIAAVTIESASAKIRNGPPMDDDVDLKLPVWTGVIPIAMRAQASEESRAADQTFPIPDYVTDWRLAFNRKNQDNSDKESGISLPSDVSIPLDRQPYLPRVTEMQGVKTIAQRRFKIYTIHSIGKQVEPTVVSAAIRHAENNTQWPTDDSGFGFVTVHFGESIWLLVDLWKDDILCHFVFRSDYTNPNDFVPGPEDGTSACVWELEVTKHERDAWVRHIMSNPNAPDFENYLEDNLTISN